jgi:hypothetical protein
MGWRIVASDEVRGAVEKPAAVPCPLFVGKIWLDGPAVAPLAPPIAAVVAAAPRARDATVLAAMALLKLDGRQPARKRRDIMAAESERGQGSVSERRDEDLGLRRGTQWWGKVKGRALGGRRDIVC